MELALPFRMTHARVKVAIDDPESARALSGAPQYLGRGLARGNSFNVKAIPDLVVGDLIRDPAYRGLPIDECPFSSPQVRNLRLATTSKCMFKDQVLFLKSRGGGGEEVGL